jgi:copper resistance protein B
MILPVKSPNGSRVASSWRNRALALTAGGCVALLFRFDIAFASQPPIPIDAQAAGHPPTDAPAQKPSGSSADSSPAPMKGMDMPATPPVPEAPMKGMDTPATPPAPEAPMKGMDMGTAPPAGGSMGKMDTGSMQGGKAPPNARDPDAYAEGYAYTGMPGMEQSDHIKVTKLLIDELEFLSGNEGNGVNWTAEGNYGGDHDKLWVRTQGQKIPGEIPDPTTGAEVLWWHASSPFWGTQLGLRQDFGPGSHTYAAFGVQGVAPGWFEIQATGYVGDDGRLSARLKASYDMRLTNRLILTPSIETNLYSKPDTSREIGAGLGNIETGLRLRYEVHRKFAPYIGYVKERSFAGTADQRRAVGNPVNERRFVAGFRMWL